MEFPESIQENEIHKILWDFKKQIESRMKMKATEKIGKYLDLARGRKKAVEHANDDDILAFLKKNCDL